MSEGVRVLGSSPTKKLMHAKWIAFSICLFLNDYWKVELLENGIGRCYWKNWKMELDLLVKRIRKIGKCSWKHWKMKLGTLEIGSIGNWYWKHWKDGVGRCYRINWKMEWETLKDGVRNIGEWNWKHWQMELRTLENDIWNRTLNGIYWKT